MLKVLFTGKHDNHPSEDGSYYDVDPLYCSVTLIQAEGRNILIDSSFYSATELLMTKLKENGLKADDITDIVNTHYHFDHCVNNILFKNATKYSPSGYVLPNGKARIYIDRTKLQGPANIKIMQTPGHTYSHCSPVYRWEDKTYVMAGCAFRESWFERDKPFHAENFIQAIESMKEIFEIADVIIPGHGRILEGEDLRKTREMVEKKFREWDV